MRLIKQTSYPEVPWKNGGGTTQEIFVEPAADGAFAWRVSVARVACDGPFSSFPGIDRHIMLLSGQAMRLSTPQWQHRLVPFAPFSFSGDEQVTGHVSDGEVQDFNLMVNRSFGSGALHFKRAPQQERIIAQDGPCLIYLITVSEPAFAASPGDSLYLAQGESFTLPAQCTFALCQISFVVRQMTVV